MTEYITKVNLIMQTIKVNGRIYPSTVSLDFAQSSISFTMDTGTAVKMAFRIVQSQVETLCDMESYSRTDIEELVIRCTDFVKVAVNMACFSTGIGMLLIFEEVVYPNGQREPIIQGYSRQGPLCTAYKFPSNSPEELKNFNKVLVLLTDDINLMGALNDLSYNLISHHQTPIICGRVVDSLRRSVAPGLDRKKGWLLLHAAINAERRYIEYISECSIDPRHGDWSPIAEATVEEVMKRTWITMNRFIEYRKRGNQPLSTPEFPQLLSSNEPS